MPDWIKIYQRLPYPLRVAVASGRGYQLQRWRYGAQTETLVQQALERDQWTDSQWQTWREEKLAHILHRAATQVPYYRERWQHRRRQGDKTSWELLENWPLLPKQAVRAHPQQFVADDCQIDKLFCDHTSGTTGTPLLIWLSQATNISWYALFEARARQWYGLSRQERWAILGGQLVVSAEQKKPPFWVWNVALNQLYLSAYHLQASTVKAYLDALRKHGVTYLLGYASSLYELACLAQATSASVPPLKVAISNAEPLFDYQRQMIEQVFNCPVRSTYGMAEIVCAASECEAGQMHLWPDVGWLEILSFEADEPVNPGDEGRFVCTSLLNADMPLIRYAVGDTGTVAPQGTKCSCGRNLPLLKSVEGRLDDVILTADGRRIGRLDPVFKADMPIVEAQIIQESMAHIRVLVVPDVGYDVQTAQEIIRRLQERVGNFDITLETIDRIPRTANGKFRSVISHIVSV